MAGLRINIAVQPVIAMRRSEAEHGIEQARDIHLDDLLAGNGRELVPTPGRSPVERVAFAHSQVMKVPLFCGEISYR